MTEAAPLGTPFHTSTAARNHTTWWYGWGGYVVPDVYTDLHTEMRAIRTTVSMNEMSPIPKVAVSGPDAQACVDHLLPRDISKMDVGTAWYTPWSDERGKVVADGIVFRHEDRFVLSGDKSRAHFEAVSCSFDASFADVIHPGCDEPFAGMIDQPPDSIVLLQMNEIRIADDPIRSLRLHRGLLARRPDALFSRFLTAGQSVGNF